MTYDEACESHAIAQGLARPRTLLQEYGFPCTLLQTGGFVMVLKAYHDPHVQVWVTQHSDGCDDDNGEPEPGPCRPTYLVCAYDGQDDEQELASKYDVPLSQLVSTVQTYALQVYDV